MYTCFMYKGYSCVYVAPWSVTLYTNYYSIYGDLKNELQREKCYYRASSCCQTNDQIPSIERSQNTLGQHKLYLLV
mgnify:CR=1 FL=1